MSYQLIEELQEAAADLEGKKPNLKNKPDLLREAAIELERMRKIIDSRPAINAGLPHTYIEWSKGIYAADVFNSTLLIN